MRSVIFTTATLFLAFKEQRPKYVKRNTNKYFRDYNECTSGSHDLNHATICFISAAL